MSHAELAKTIDEAFERREQIGPTTKGPVREAAEEAGLNLTALSHVHALFDLAGQEGRGDQGTQALFAMVEKTAARQ